MDKKNKFNFMTKIMKAERNRESLLSKDFRGASYFYPKIIKSNELWFFE
ncbi:hypothetical protein SAMN05216365_10356 [Porphyromonadaceae bacterium NLAE-zl-C104]|nr:hypothetical protein SAMN05216365_10356 [Porphyromonadaceae bacterium NLAE-zl-C104]